MAMVALPPPGSMPVIAWHVAAVAALMAIWWVTEALPLAATALLPLLLLPLTGAASLGEAAAPYSNPLIFLFLGGFIVARAIERWGIHTRIANAALRLAPGSPAGIVAAMMTATAFLSMWISNTAAAMVMVPIAASVASGKGREFAAALLLGVAFSASIGGMATLVGTPPNALLAGYLETSLGIDVGFAQWMMIGLPVALVLLPVTWLILAFLAFDLDRDAQASQPVPADSGHEALEEMLAPDTGPMDAGTRLTAWIAGIAVILLVLRPWLQSLAPSLVPDDAGIAIGAALLLLALPAPGMAGKRLVDWEHAAEIRWDVLILFGGGLSLAAAIEASGLSLVIGGIFTALDFLPAMLILLAAMVLMVLLGELASNTAMAAVFLPIAGAAASGLGLAPVELVVPIGLAASLGFMLPVATPPNAIAYGTGLASGSDMLKAGALVDLAGIAIVFAASSLLAPFVFGP